MQRTPRHTIAAGLSLLAIALTAGCGGLPTFFGQDANQGAGVQLSPLANAGPDREILRGFRARLSASGTLNPSGQPLTYLWEQLEGEAVHLSNPTELAPSFLAPLDEQPLRFRLTVSNGAWRTQVDVKLLVRRQPLAQAPRALTAADRYLDDAEDDEPLKVDVVGLTPDTAEHFWERITPLPAGSHLKTADSDSSIKRPSLLRLRAEADGLRSAPDYLILWPHSAEAQGQEAPKANVSAPSVVAPGELFEIDAQNSSDPNGDALFFHWEQVRGTPIVTEGQFGAKLVLQAPFRAQELGFRIRVHDGRLYSQALDVAVVVTHSSDGSITVNPLADRLTHAGNKVWLDALGGAPLAVETSEIVYQWSQTYGPPLPLMAETENGRLVSFNAPEILPTLFTANGNDVAFAVLAAIDPVQGAPLISRITVVDAETNEPPALFVCPTSQVAVPGGTVLVTAHSIDAESDPLLDVVWWLDVVDAGADESVEDDEFTEGLLPRIEPVDSHGAYPIDQATCPAPIRVLPENALHVRTESINVLFADHEQSVLLHVKSCDTLGACSTNSVLFEP